MKHGARFVVLLLLLMAVSLTSCSGGGTAPSGTSESHAAGSDKTGAETQNPSTAAPEEDTKDLVAQLSNDVAAAIMKKDAQKLAGYVHPVKGLRISPYGYVEPDTDPIVSIDRIAGLFSEKDKLDWGICDDNGNPVLLTPLGYFDQYVVSKYSTKGERTTDEYLVGTNLTEIYPDSVIIEHRCGEEEGIFYDHMLLLIYENYNDKWYLTGLVPVLVDN